MHNKFEINWTKIKGGCQSVRKVVPHDSKSDLPLGNQPVSQSELQLNQLSAKSGFEFPKYYFHFLNE